MQKIVRIYNSFEEADKDEAKRRSEMSVEERLAVFAAIQERVWGERWTDAKLERVVSIEKLEWTHHEAN